MTLACRLVLFDLDGTLVDSSPGIHSSVRHAATELGLRAPTAAQLRDMVGPPLQDGFALVLGVPSTTCPGPSPPTGRTTPRGHCST
jgi:phosphoglycolate phosphatase